MNKRLKTYEAHKPKWTNRLESLVIGAIVGGAFLYIIYHLLLLLSKRG